VRRTHRVFCFGSTNNKSLPSRAVKVDSYCLCCQNFPSLAFRVRVSEKRPSQWRHRAVRRETPHWIGPARGCRSAAGASPVWGCGGGGEWRNAVQRQLDASIVEPHSANRKPSSYKTRSAAQVIKSVASRAGKHLVFALPRLSEPCILVFRLQKGDRYTSQFKWNPQSRHWFMQKKGLLQARPFHNSLFFCWNHEMKVLRCFPVLGITLMKVRGCWALSTASSLRMGGEDISQN